MCTWEPWGPAGVRVHRTKCGGTCVPRNGRLPRGSTTVAETTVRELACERGMGCPPGPAEPWCPPEP